MKKQITSIRLPLQAVPVERTVSPSAITLAGGLDPSIDWGSILGTGLNILKTVGPGLLGAL